MSDENQTPTRRPRWGTGIFGQRAAARSVKTVWGHGRDSVSRTKGMITAFKNAERGGVAIDPEVEGERERFREAMRVNGKSMVDIDRSVRVTHDQFWAFAILALFALLIPYGLLAIQGFAAPAIWPLELAFRGLLFLPMAALAIRAGFTNHLFRTRRLVSLRDWFRSGRILPSRTPDDDRPKAANDGARPSGRFVAGMFATLVAFLTLVPGETLAQATSVTDVPNATELFEEPEEADLFMNLLSVIIPNVGPVGADTDAGGVTGQTEALKNAFFVFSSVLLLVATILTTWQILSSMVAQAKEGQLLGRRYHEVWAPLRLVIGYGMLMPIAGGFCAAQVLVVYLIVWGGNVANHVWQPYVATIDLIAENEGAEALQYIARPMHNQTSSDIVRSLWIGEMCHATFKAYIDRNSINRRTRRAAGTSKLRKMIEDNPQWEPVTKHWLVFDTDPYEVLDWGSGCGSVKVPLVNRAAVAEAFADGDIGRRERDSRILAADLRDKKRDLIKQVHNEIRTAVASKGIGQSYVDPDVVRVFSEDDPDIARYITDARNTYVQGLLDYGTAQYDALGEGSSGRSDIVSRTRDRAMDYGWAGAGTFYLTLAALHTEAMGDYSNIAEIEPPDLDQLSDADTFSQIVDNDGYAPLGLFDGFNRYWSDNVAGSLEGLSFDDMVVDPDAGKAERMSVEVAEWLQGWFANHDVRPHNALEGMVHTGGTLMTTGWVMWGTSTMLDMVFDSDGLGGKIAGKAGGGAGQIGMKLGGGAAFLLKYGGIVLLLVGMVHTYVLPMIPYVMSLLFVAGMLVLMIEALVAAPIWAFSHVRMDGEEFVDQVQRPGYAIAFNLFMRPSLMIFGLVLSYLMFGALAFMVGVTFKGAMMGLLNMTAIGLIGQIVMIVILTFIHYQLAIKSFEQIVQIPDRVMRWFGQGMGENLHEAEDTMRAVGFFNQHTTSRAEGMLTGGGGGGRRGGRVGGGGPDGEGANGSGMGPENKGALAGDGSGNRRAGGGQAAHTAA